MTNRKVNLPIGVRAYLQDYMASDVAPVLRKRSTWNRNLLMLILASVVFLAAIGEQREPLNDQTAENRQQIIGDLTQDPALELGLKMAFIAAEAGNAQELFAQVKP